MSRLNGPVIKNKIGLRLIFVVNPQRVLHSYAISAPALICEDFRQSIHNCAVILSDSSHNHDLSAQKFDPVVFGQDSCFGEFIKLGNREFPGLRLNRHTKSYGAFRHSATRISGSAFGVRRLVREAKAGKGVDSEVGL